MFNESRNTSYFLFLIRTSYNGLIRYNRDNGFNVGLHFTRKGIHPDKLKNILINTNYLVNLKDVKFEISSYNDILNNINKDDFIYFDPPYYNSKLIYYGNFDYNKFFSYIKGLNCNYALSFDGNSRNNIKIDNNLYTEHYYINNGNSSFSRLKNKKININESLYLKLENN